VFLAAARPCGSQAREEIAALLSVITEGRDTPDLVDARAVVAS